MEKGLGLLLHTGTKKTLLTDRMKKQHIQFAKKYEHWTSAEWQEVMFSDESTFQVLQMHHPVTLPPASQYDPAYTVLTVKQPNLISVQECFSGREGSEGLYFLSKNIMMK